MKAVINIICRHYLSEYLDLVLFITVCLYFQLILPQKSMAMTRAPFHDVFAIREEFSDKE